MNKENHGKITREALKETGLSPNAIDLIAMANQDSDHVSAASALAEQHFCGTGDSKDDGPLVVALCNSFIDDVFQIAALLTRRSNSEEITDALYFTGRAFHCIQDFYAHSNWIALKNKETWHGLASPPALKFCNATPLVNNLMFENTPLYRYNLKKWIHRSSRRTKDYKKLITRGVSLCHPDMHLDYKDSWADEVISDAGKIGGGGAFNLAYELAKKTTLRQWVNFLGKVMDDRYSPTSPFAIAKWKGFQANLKYGFRYSDRYNDAGCDAKLAIMNLKTHDPGKVDRHGMENARRIFNNYFQIKYKRGIMPSIAYLRDHKKDRFDGFIF